MAIIKVIKVSWENILRKGYKGMFYLGKYDGDSYEIEGQKIPEGTLLNEVRNFNKPTITLFGEHDMAFIGGEKFFIEKIPGAKDMHHQIINAGHFSQENQPELIAKTILSI